MSNTETFVIFSDKSRASYVTKRLRDHGIIAGMRGKRGEWEVFGFPPSHMTASKCGEMALQICDKWERR